MPDRPGVDDNDALKNLVGVWRDGSADLDSRLGDVWRRIDLELSASEINSNTVRRLRIQADRLNELQRVAERSIDDLTQGTRRFIDEGEFDNIYASGAARAASAAVPFAFSAPHRAAVDVLAQDLFDDVLVMSDFIDQDSKRFVREIGRQLTGFKLTGGVPAREQARRLARELKPEFARRGMGAVVYRDGSRHGFGEYAEMLIRTKTGVAYNTGTLNQGRLAGIEFYELLDGAQCGLTAHHDPQLANGLIVDYDTAMAFPLAHPNCRRSTNPRPDLNRGNVNDAVSVQSPEARADQAAFEEALRQQGERRAGRRERRARRTRPSRAQRQAQVEQQRQRAIRAAERQAGIDRAKEVLAEQRRRALLSPADRDLEDLARAYGVTAEQVRAARPVAAAIKKDIREVAAREADELGNWIFQNDMSLLRQPKPLRKRKDVHGNVRYVRDDSGYDWFEQLTQAERNRVMHRMNQPGSELHAPDVLAEQVRRTLNKDWTDDEAIQWVLGQWLREDAMRSVAAGRNPKYWNIDDLFANDYEMEGYRLSELFGQGVTKDHAAAHVASVQAQQAKVYAERTLGRAPRLGPAPYELTMDEFVFQLDELAEFLGSNIEPTLERAALDRLRELVPPDIDPTGTMNAFELYEEIRIVAQTAGRI